MEEYRAFADSKGSSFYCSNKEGGGVNHFVDDQVSKVPKLA